jgi:putative peptidoglycan lipid II flippase
VSNVDAAESEQTAENPYDEASSIAGETIDQVGSAGGESPRATSRSTTEKSTGKSAFMVGAGILISRIVGLIRQRVFAHYFGTSAAGDAFSAAFRIPNFLQNIFGEGALSASFIPVYAKLLAHHDEEEATHVANAVLGILALTVALIVLTGVLTTPYLISLIAPGFKGETRELTIRLVRILFPARACWYCQPGVWACLTATTVSSFLTLLPTPGTWQ